MKKTTASSTVNPLHFEDLEPHRFEDLIRQLAHGFRPWARLEATGRLGGDEGTDIRGLELVSAPVTPDDDMSTEDEETVTHQVVGEREWRIQCKRYKTIGPKLMREIVAEAVPDSEHAPHGIIIAAACDVSAQAMAAFHDERLKLGVPEGHLWTKAHLEDLLFLPQNDHLLFAYFGLSFQVRSKSRARQVQAELTVKRKLLRAFNQKDVGGFTHEDVLIRDVQDEHYPYEGEVYRFHQLNFPPWFPCVIIEFHPRGLLVSRRSFSGWVTPDGEWDVLPQTFEYKSYLGTSVFWEEHEPVRALQQRGKELTAELLSNVPEQERHDVLIVRKLPLQSILEVDPTGDRYYEAPHLFCRFNPSTGPYPHDHVSFVIGHGFSRQWLDPDKQRPLFHDLAKKVLKPTAIKKITFLNK